tara:strand:+ start:8032 stop:8334 length:303 start_codon:yes stop_codon:yes gene_type:complete
MKIKKNGKVVDLTESEIKEIVKQYKIKRFLSEDRQSRMNIGKNRRIEEIISKLKELNEMLKSTEYGTEVNKILNDIDNSVETQIERIEDKINKKESKKES